MGIRIGVVQRSGAIAVLLAAAVTALFTLHAVDSAATGCTLPSGSPSPSASPSSSPSASPTPTDLVPTVALAAAPHDSAYQSPETPPPGPSNPCPSTLEISVTPGRDVVGNPVFIAGRLTCSGIALSDGLIQLMRKLPGIQYANLKSVLTNARGEVNFTDFPPANAIYKLVYQSSDGTTVVEQPPETTAACGSASSVEKIVQVAVGIRVNLESSSTPRLGQAATFVTQVVPAHAGQKVMLQALLQQKWQTVSTMTLDSASKARATYRRTTKGRILLRVAYATQHNDHAWNISRSIWVTWS